MGFSYAVDMINRMKQDRSRNRLNKKRSKSITRTMQLNNEYPKKITYKTVPLEELEVIKSEIRKKIKREKVKTLLATIVSLLILLIFIYLFLKYLWE